MSNYEYGHANEIYPGLWLGDVVSSTDKTFLKQHNIKCIINCTCTMPFCDIKGILKFRVPVLDDMNVKQIYKLYLMLNKCSKLIAKTLPNQNILVHCHAGRQRSVSIVAAFMMKYGKLTKNEALMLIKSKRKISAMKQANFDSALNQYEQDLKSLLVRS